MSPRTQDSLDALLGAAADEYTQALQRGERPAIEQYVAKYPEIADELRKVLPTVRIMQQPEVTRVLADQDPYIGKTLGDFRLVRKIGHGGMGIVYEAVQLSLKRRVAVKILPAAAAMDQRKLKRFTIEAEAAASLQHEHIVPVYSVGCEAGVHFFAMQYVEGQSLAQIIRELRRLTGRMSPDPEQTGTLPHAGASAAAETEASGLSTVTLEGSKQSPEYFQTVARLGFEAATGLEHAHQRFVTHRDIKPANLLVDHRGNLWIADFGLAQMRSDIDFTVTGELLGTLRYMSPEQAMANRVPLDHRTDVYSLGATLYELLTLQPACAGSNRHDLLRQVMFDDPRPPRCVNPHVPRDLETIVMTALAKSPAARYPTAKEFAEDLQRFLNDQPIKARPEPLLRRLWRRSRRHASSIALSLAGIITAAALIVLLVHLNQPSPEEVAHTRQQEALATLTQELDTKPKVTLLGERGAPSYFRWRTSEKPAKVLAADDGAFTAQNWEHGLLELLPDPRMQRYRFSAEVRHEGQAHHQSRVGIYFAHSEYAEGDKLDHFDCTVAFNDLIEVDQNGMRTGNGVGLEVHRHPSFGKFMRRANVASAQAPIRPAMPNRGLGPWHGVAVHVRPESITVYWRNDCEDKTSRWECIAATPRKLLLREARSLIARPEQLQLPADAPQFAPRGGLGLFVSLGVASFRNVIVERLGDEP
jgi:serine/threonine protein kinase